MKLGQSELAHIQEFFELCAEMLCAFDAQGAIVFTNPAFRETFGLEPGTESVRFLELVHGSDRRKTEKALSSLTKTGSSFSNRCRVKDGSYRTMEWSAQAHAQSGIRYLLGHDVTEGRAQERAQHEMTTRHEAILAAVPDIIAEVDTRKVYTWINRAGYDFFGPDVIGKEASFFFEGSSDSVYAHVQPLFDGSEDTIYVESWQRRKDGEKRLLAWWCRGLKDENGRVVGALSTARDVTEQRKLEAALGESEQTVEALFENAAQGILSAGPDGRIVTANSMAEKLFGYSRAELLGLSIEDLMPASRGEAHARHRAAYFAAPRSRPMGIGMDLIARRKDGSEFPVEISLSHIASADPPLAVAFVNDISERKRAESERERLEHRLEHATKMEAVGRLAGGIAHDFNNLLTALSGFAEIALDELPKDHPLYQGAKETFKTCQRSTALVRRLLAMSRRQLLQPEVLDLNAKIAEIEKMLRSVLREDIDLVVKLEEGLGSVRADQSQIEQVILNLVVNARDAMPTGGRLTIETANTEVDESVLEQRAGMKSGPYVLLTVSDTGHGMDAETLVHVFEPYFTTKEKGKGTGLGLATVYGIVKQSEGHIWVYSEPGDGTTFKIYLPRIDPVGTEEGDSVPAASERRGSETILVVEDENTVRLVAVANLRKAGYRVLEATDGEDALRVVEAHEGPLDLVLTDVLMPRLNGPALVTRLKKRFPSIVALYMSGHADDALIHHGILEGGLSFIDKPFTRADLTRRVREVLDRSQRSSE